MIASQDTGLSPERIRNDPEARRRWSGHRVEGFVVIVRPRWHHQGTGGAECITEGVDQADWSSLDRPRGPERRVYEQHTTLVDAECAELIGHPMQGFAGAAGRFGEWLAKVPSELSGQVTLEIPGMPESGGTDHASFLCAGVPAFSFHVGAGRSGDLPMGTNRWDTSVYTWHTNRDTFDKVIFEDLRDDAVMTAMLVYLASEDPERMPRDQRAMPDGSQWPECRPPARSSGESVR